ncbi:MAG: molybdopterin molybdotransferase MoeA [Solirubrobacteraceae bacterium]
MAPPADAGSPASPAPPRLLSIDEALAVVAAQVVPLPAEEVELEHVQGRFLAEDLRASIDLPPFDSSAMDGYALHARDAPGRLTVVGESAAGAPYGGDLGAGEAIVISTGAVVPAQADAVAPLEDAGGGGREIELTGAVAPGAFVRGRGSDVQRGAWVLGAGTRLGPAQIGAAAAIGLGTLSCGRRPSVAVLSTGSELRAPGQRLGEGEIYDSNTPMLSAALASSGALVQRIPAAADTPEAHRVALRRALEHDVVISTGGVSVGDHDLVRGVGRALGVRELFWRVALRPGKPLAFGVRGSTLVFGLPGNPVSTLVCFELFVRPALLALQGAPSVRPAWGAAWLGAAVPRNSQRDELIRVRISAPGARPVLEPLTGQESHQIAIAAQADGLALIPTGSGELDAGTEVAYLPLRPV